MDYFPHIERNPQICGGAHGIKGTRVTLRTMLTSLAEGASIEEITADFPTISAEDVRAVIAFAAASAEDCLAPKIWQAAQRENRFLEMQQFIDSYGPTRRLETTS